MATELPDIDSTAVIGTGAVRSERPKLTVFMTSLLLIALV
jgi:hypothetical protein